MTNRRRIWSELLPLDAVRHPRTLALLARYRLELAVAVRPDTVAELPDLAAACADAGVPLAIWPMLADEDGRWAGAGNVAAFGAFVDRVLSSLDALAATRSGSSATVLGAAEIVFDLEPPIDAVRAALSGLPGVLRLLGAGDPRHRGQRGRREQRDGPERAFAELAGGLAPRGVAVSAAVVPLVLLDGPDRSWERALGTPVSAVAWSHVSAMLYTSMIEGWSRGLLGRGDAVSLLAWGCRAAARRFGEAAGASLGLVGAGALGDEPVYRSPDELREDVAVATHAGIGRLALFDLGGVLGRPPAEAWLEAFVEAPLPQGGAPIAPTPRARCALAAAALAGRASRLAGRASRCAGAARTLGLRRNERWSIA